MPIGYDINMPLRYDPVDGFYALSKTENARVKQNLKMLMLTAPGERIILPNYGVGLRNYLFELNPEIQIITRIQEQITIYMPDLQVVNLQVKKDQDIPNKFGQKNTLFVKIEYVTDEIDLLQTFELLEQSVL